MSDLFQFQDQQKTGPDTLQIWLQYLHKSLTGNSLDSHLRIDPDLYQCFRLSYDALPNSNINNRFLCCATYPEDYGLPVEHYLVRSKRQSHFMTWSNDDLHWWERGKLCNQGRPRAAKFPEIHNEDCKRIISLNTLTQFIFPKLASLLLSNSVGPN